MLLCLNVYKLVQNVFVFGIVIGWKTVVLYRDQIRGCKVVYLVTGIEPLRKICEL